LPNITRYFPVSHDLIHDPEMIELETLYGDWMLAVWLQMLSIADRNDGEIRGTPEYIAKSLTWLWKSNSRRYNAKWRVNELLMAFEWMSNKGWIEAEWMQNGCRIRAEWKRNESSIDAEWMGFYVCNYAKYHRTRAGNSHPPKRPNLPNLPNLLKMQTAPSADPVDKSKKKGSLDPKVKEVADRIYKGNPPRFGRLIAWIKDKEKRDYPVEVIVETLVLFEEQDKKNKIKDWWPYIERIHTKVYGQWNEAQAAKVKGEESKFISNVVRSLSGGMKP
jgi:hypothetical protein